MQTKKIYEQVRDLIEEEAKNKNPGEEIDTEVKYARRFGVSRPTVRKAVEELIQIGMLRRVPGKGLVMATQGEMPYRGKLLIALPHSVGDGFLFRVLMGCIEQANALGFDYKILSSSNYNERLEHIKKERLEDYVAAVTCCYDDNDVEPEIVERLLNAKIPVMLVDNPSERRLAPCITCDDFMGGYVMGDYLAKKGHKRIINISHSRKAQTIIRRDQGFLKALFDNGVQYDKHLLLREKDYASEFINRFSPEDFFTGRYTAICSHTSLAIVAISRWLAQNCIRVYDDVSIIGYGDYAYLPVVETPFTSIEVPSVQMGRSAVSEISAAILEGRSLKNVQHEVWLEKRHTVKTID